jgi:hypothetical protein
MARDREAIAPTVPLRGERGVGLRKFLEGEARNLGDDVINNRVRAAGLAWHDECPPIFQLFCGDGHNFVGITSKQFSTSNAQLEKLSASSYSTGSGSTANVALE